MSNLINEHLEPVHFQENEFLFEERESSFHFYIIQSGKVEIYRTSNDGTKIPLGVVGPGEALGEFAKISGESRSANAIARTQVTAIKVSEAVYDKIYEELPGWAQAMLESLVARVRKMNELFEKHKVIDSSLLK